MADFLIAEFETDEDLLKAIRDMRGQGYTDLDAYVPFPHLAVEEALGLPRSKLPWVALIAGLLGGGAAYFLMWWITAIAYPLNVGAFPLHSPPAFVPVTFEITVLSAGITAFVSVLVVGGLPKLWDPIFEVEGFERASIDRFWLRVNAADPRFDPKRTADALSIHHPLRLVRMEPPR